MYSKIVMLDQLCTCEPFEFQKTILPIRLEAPDVDMVTPNYVTNIVVFYFCFTTIIYAIYIVSNFGEYLIL